MTSQKLNSIDLDSSNDSDVQIAESSGPKNAVSLSGSDETDDDEVVSPRKNLHSVVLSDDEEEHLVRLDLHEQAHEEQLEGLLNLGVAERRRPVRDRMHTVSKVVGGHLLFSVEPVAAAASTGHDEGADAVCGRDCGENENQMATAEKTTERAGPTSSRRKAVSSSSSDTSEQNDRDFIVSDSATPSYHESAGDSDDTEVDEVDPDDEDAGAAAPGIAKAAGSGEKHCQCQCQCPACRRCEFKCRRRWLQRRQKKVRPADVASGESGSGDNGSASVAGKKRRSNSGIFSIRDSDDENSTAYNDDGTQQAMSTASMCISQKRKRYS